MQLKKVPPSWVAVNANTRKQSHSLFARYT